MRRRAVVFDDEALIRFTLWKFFDERGYEVLTFTHPGQCLLNVVKECPCPSEAVCADLIISDVNMQTANGLDFLEQLTQKGCRQRHFALMSGSFLEADLARGSQLGCKLFSKPLDMGQLIAWVEEVEKSTPADRALLDWR